MDPKRSAARTATQGCSEDVLSGSGSNLLRDFANPAAPCPLSDLNFTNAETGRCSQRPDFLHRPGKERRPAKTLAARGGAFMLAVMRPLISEESISAMTAMFVNMARPGGRRCRPGPERAKG